MSVPVRHPVQRRDETILTAAHQLLIEQGFGRMSMRCLSQRAGLQPGSLYHHFSSKEEVLEEVLGTIVERRLCALRQLRPVNRSPWPYLQAFIAFHVEHVLEQQEDQAMLRSERRYLGHDALQRLKALEGRYYQEVHRRVREGAIAGVFASHCTDMAAHMLCQVLDCMDGFADDGATQGRAVTTQWMIELAARLLQVRAGAR